MGDGLHGTPNEFGAQIPFERHVYPVPHSAEPGTQPHVSVDAQGSVKQIRIYYANKLNIRVTQGRLFAQVNELTLHEPPKLPVHKLAGICRS